MDKQDLEIRSRTKILSIYIEVVERKLNSLQTLQAKSVRHDGVQVLRATIEELKNHHQNVKDQFDAVTAELGISSENFQDSKARLVSLQKEEENFVMDRLSNLMTEALSGFDLQVSKKEESEVEMVMLSVEESDDISCDDIDTNIEGLKEDMCSSLLESTKTDVIKKDHCNAEKRLLDLIEAIGESDEEQEVVKAVEDRAVKLGIELSRQLLDVMIMLSESDQVLEMFRNFRSSLGFHQIEKPVAINKFVYLLDMAETKLKNKKILQGSSVDESKHKENAINESQLEQLFDKFLSEIFRLEMILKDHGLFDLGIKQYEEDLKALQVKVIELGVLSSFIHGSTDEDESLKKSMELKINEIWTHLEKP